MKAPTLHCPVCGAPAFPAKERAVCDADGNWEPHLSYCTCGDCDWIWWDDAPPHRCACGATIRVVVDDGSVSAEELPS